MMQVFYSPDITGNELILDRNESRHIIRVLRMKKGDPVKLIDGKGSLYDGVIDNPDQNSCSIMITASYRGFEKRSYNLHMAVSPLKNMDRYEWYLEKSVEIGIDSITPLLCRNTEKESVKSDRLNNIIISAMKQSLKAFRPQLNAPCRFEEFVTGSFTGLKFIAHCNENFIRKGIHEIYKPGDDAIIMIGPEGDFSKNEIEEAYRNGFTGINLGTSRLRTETAGVAACHSIYYENLRS
jgi:16S rRNA (uracil1498-N3)-methyltransferase